MAKANTQYIELPNPKQEEILRQMRGEERMRIGFEICEFVKTLVMAGVRNQFPNISEQELNKKIRERYQAIEQ